MSAEHAAIHEVASIHPLAVANEARALAERVKELKKKLTLVPHVQGLREALVKAEVALEIAVICAKDIEDV